MRNHSTMRLYTHCFRDCSNPSEQDWQVEPDPVGRVAHDGGAARHGCMSADVTAEPAPLPDLPGGPYDVEFFFDPGCPFAWQTSRWIRRVTELRDVKVGWRFISLAYINEGNEPNEQMKQAHARTRAYHRICAAARDRLGNDAVGDLYRAYGDRFWSTRGRGHVLRQDGGRRRQRRSGGHPGRARSAGRPDRCRRRPELGRGAARRERRSVPPHRAGRRHPDPHLRPARPATRCSGP